MDRSGATASVAVFDALADPVRREILALLRSGPLSAGQIAAPFAISRPAISRHLRTLRASGLVVAEGDDADGRLRRYRLEVGPLDAVDALVASLRAGPAGAASGATASSGPRWPSALDALETEVARTRRDRRQAARAADPRLDDEQTRPTPRRTTA